MITWMQMFYRVSMRATGSTSTKWGPDDPADGLHPVLHITLGAGHEQERLGVGRHLLPLPGTTWKTGRHRLIAGTLGQRKDALPTALSPAPTPVNSLFLELGESPLSNTFQQQPALCSIFAAHPFHTSHVYLWGTIPKVSLFSLILIIFPYQTRNLKIILGHLLEKSMQI